MSGTEQYAQVGDLKVCYETFGDSDRPPLLLIMGLNAQMVLWEDEFCERLADRGFWVIRFDNRDCGRSTTLRDKPIPTRTQLLLRHPRAAAYALEEMADDATGLLDVLEVDSAHVVGASMGGMIAQLVAIRHPERVRSLTSIMSTTGDPSVGMPAEAAMGVLLAPPATDRASAIERALDTYRVIGSPGFEFDETGLRDRSGLSFDRAYDPAGVARQLAAILTTHDRTADLGEVSVPTLV